ncbi:hypothetical protein [Bradyrhizobium australiense]|uniref:Uncharacterized protein n=1 Tax=Bradyrhizobium australiense TaxID=2721161 RepID=A0A7Y4GWR5_9BRAD|nr:hypothetical protein [Bradyrhizobium australiense]NOJ42792.1 hypothetical protein [Bradyrhizobium australiense]
MKKEVLEAILGDGENMPELGRSKTTFTPSRPNRRFLISPSQLYGEDRRIRAEIARSPRERSG